MCLASVSLALGMKKNASIILKEEAAVVDGICYILEGGEMEIFITNINIKHLKINT